MLARLKPVRKIVPYYLATRLSFVMRAPEESASLLKVHIIEKKKELKAIYRLAARVGRLFLKIITIVTLKKIRKLKFSLTL